MSEQILREILDPAGGNRVTIVRRSDGRFSYRRQEKRDGSWGPPTVDSGVYDSADTAEIEARQRVPWLKALFH